MKTDNVFFNFCHPFLDKLSDGKILKHGFSIFFYIIGVLFFLASALFGYQFLDIDVNIWSVILFVSFVFTGWILFQICWYRARSVKSVPDSQFVVSAIFSIFIRSLGEMAATVFTVTGFVAGLVPLLSDQRGAIADAGPVAIVVGPIIGFLVITLFYFIAERLSVLPQIAVNTDKNSGDEQEKNSSQNDLLDS